jgi:hypothetical protein
LSSQQTGGQSAGFGGIRRNEPNFINSDIRARQRGFQLIGQDRGLGIIRRESADQAL